MRTTRNLLLKRCPMWSVCNLDFTFNLLTKFYDEKNETFFVFPTSLLTYSSWLSMTRIFDKSNSVQPTVRPSLCRTLSIEQFLYKHLFDNSNSRYLEQFSFLFLIILLSPIRVRVIESWPEYQIEMYIIDVPRLTNLIDGAIRLVGWR